MSFGSIVAWALLVPLGCGQSQGTQASKPEYFDEPQFIVSGVTDYSYRGGHGSDSVLRSTEALTKATASLSKPSPASGGEAERHHSLADADEQQGNALDAVHEFEHAAELDPSERNVFDWGAELLKHRAPDPAIEVFTKGTRLFPDSTRMLLGLGAAFYARGKYNEAARRFFEALDLHPTDPIPYVFLSKMRVNEITQSEAYMDKFARFAKLQPDNALANYYYADCLWKRRTSPEESTTTKQVRLLLEKAIRLDANLAPAYLLLGTVHAQQKGFPNAISAYRKAVELDPGLEEAHYRLSQAYTLSGEKVKAQTELEVYQQLSNESAKKSERERRELQQFVFTLRDQ